MEQEKKEVIRSKVLSLGADVCGMAAAVDFTKAPVGFSPVDVYADCQSVISFGIALPKGVLEVNPGVIYSHFNGEILSKQIDGIAFSLARYMEREFGCIVVPVPCDGPYDSWEAESMTGKGLISMKHAAVLCGLGQLGKNTMLLNSVYGNMLTVGAVLTNLELESDAACENICIPGCHKCRDACPTHAIGEDYVDQKKCRPNTYGKTSRGFNTVKCNTCRTVCPRRYGL